MQPSDLLEDYLTREELARELGIAVRTLARYDALGKGPPRLRLGVTFCITASRRARG